jgi:dienelactone hydrolase
MQMLVVLGSAMLGFSGCGGSSISSNGNSQPENQNSTQGPSNLDAQTVNITSPDGILLVGSYFPAARRGSPALLLLHQWQSDRHSYDDFAKRMQAKGFSVLSIDGRGFGESTKKTDGTTISAGRTDADVKAMLGDVGAAIDFLAGHKNIDATKIGIIGASYGSSLAIIYAADNPKVAAVALLSPGLNYFGNMPTEPAVKKYGDRPLLFVAAEDDSESAESVKSLKAAANNDKYEVQVYPSGGHGTALFKVGSIMYSNNS